MLKYQTDSTYYAIRTVLNNFNSNKFLHLYKKIDKKTDAKKLNAIIASQVLVSDTLSNNLYTKKQAQAKIKEMMLIDSTLLDLPISHKDALKDSYTIYGSDKKFGMQYVKKDVSIVPLKIAK